MNLILLALLVGAAFVMTSKRDASFFAEDKTKKPIPSTQAQLEAALLYKTDPTTYSKLITAQNTRDVDALRNLGYALYIKYPALSELSFQSANELLIEHRA